MLLNPSAQMQPFLIYMSTFAANQSHASTKPNFSSTAAATCGGPPKYYITESIDISIVHGSKIENGSKYIIIVLL